MGWVWIGICKKEFDMFYRRHNHIDCTGLGMFIVKTHADKLGAAIKLKSRPMAGTEITLLFRKHSGNKLVI